MNYRQDIQRLRAFSILIVILNHSGIKLFQGGFIGVDIFFVISGYLVTKSIETLSMSYPTKNVLQIFYIRRFFRIVPVYLFSTIVIFGFARLILSPAQATNVFAEFKSCLSFVYNFHLLNVRNNYFQEISEQSPFLHFWSLSVEEQFYIVIPLILLPVYFLKRLYPIRRRILLSRLYTSFSVVFLCLSLYLYIYNAYSDPIFQYYSFLTRVWELGLGGIVVFSRWQPNFLPRTTRIIRTVSYLALLTICFSIEDVNGLHSILVPVSVLSTLVLLMVHPLREKHEGVVRKFLDYSEYLGGISYTLYLFHWPILIFSKYLIPKDFPRFLVLFFEFLLIFTVSNLLHRFLEVPARNIGYSLSGGKRTSGQSRTNTKELSQKSRILPTLKTLRKLIDRYSELMLICAFVLIIVSFFSIRETGPTKTSQFIPPQLQGPQSNSPRGDFKGAKSDTETLNLREPSSSRTPSTAPLRSVQNAEFETQLASLQKEIQLSVGMKSIPNNLKKSVLASAKESLWVRGKCTMSLKDNSCVYGNGPRLVVFVGDSHAIMHQSMVMNSFDKNKYTVVGRFYPYCKFAEVIPATTTGSAASECLTWYKSTINFLNKRKPYLLILSQLDATNIYEGDQLLDDSKSASLLAKSLRDSLIKTSKIVSKIIFIGQTPQSESISSCTDAKLNFIKNCHADPKSNSSVIEWEKNTVESTGASYLSMIPFLCTQLECPPLISGKLVFIDGSHLTQEFSRKLAPLFQAYLKKNGF